MTIQENTKLTQDAGDWNKKLTEKDNELEKLKRDVAELAERCKEEEKKRWPSITI